MQSNARVNQLSTIFTDYFGVRIGVAELCLV